MTLKRSAAFGGGRTVTGREIHAGGATTIGLATAAAGRAASRRCGGGLAAGCFGDQGTAAGGAPADEPADPEEEAAALR